MSEPNFEKGLTQALEQAITDYFEDSPTVSVNVRMGAITLKNGEEAQIHLFLTTNPDDFLDLNGHLQSLET